VTLLLLLVCSSGALQAQSGRRSDKGANGSINGGNRNSSDQVNNSTDEEGAIIPGGETIEGRARSADNRVGRSASFVPVSLAACKPFSLERLGK
jgi:hypothetical protein